MPVYTIPYESDKELNQLICDNIITAFEGGSNYWLSRVNKRVSEYAKAENYKEGFEMELTFENPNMGDDKTQVVTYAMLERGAGVMRKKFPKAYSDFVQETGDATTADIFLQCALFGELIFG